MISIWEKQSFLQVDCLILGAGITGLSTAASLKEHNPSLNIVVLERGILPSGASTKNAGFACFGSASELLADLQKLGSERMIELVSKRWNGLQKTLQRLGKHAIDLQVKSGYELIFDEDEIPDKISGLNEMLYPLFDDNVFHSADHHISSFGFGKVCHMIQNKLEGQLDTGKLMHTLWHYCNQLGIKIFTGCNAGAIKEEEEEVHVTCGDITFRASQLGVCTNAFTNQLLPGIPEVIPGRGMVMLIEPSKPLSFEGTFHYEEGFYYFRDYEGRLIFGGGRNLDFPAETTVTFDINKKIKTKLLQDMGEIILPNQSFNVAMEWTGIMAFGSTKEPIVQRLSKRIVLGVRLGGMGIAIGSLVGQEVADLLMEKV